MPGYTVHESDVDTVSEADDSVSVKTTIDARVGAEQLEQRILRFAVGGSAPRTAADRDEVAYIVSGTGTLTLDGAKHELSPDMGIFIRAGETYQVDNPGPEEIVVVSVTAPEPTDTGAAGPRKVTVRVADQPTIPAGKEMRMPSLSMTMSPKTVSLTGSSFCGPYFFQDCQDPVFWMDRLREKLEVAASGLFLH